MIEISDKTVESLMLDIHVVSWLVRLVYDIGWLQPVADAVWLNAIDMQGSNIEKNLFTIGLSLYIKLLITKRNQLI